MFKEVILGTNILGVEWIISIIIVIITLALITLNLQKWKTLALPVTVGWYIIGITPSYLWLIGTGIIFVIETLSIKVLGNTIEAITNVTKEYYQAIKHGVKKAREGYKIKTSEGYETTKSRKRKEAIKGFLSPMKSIDEATNKKMTLEELRKWLEEKRKTEKEIEDYKTISWYNRK